MKRTKVTISQDVESVWDNVSGLFETMERNKCREDINKAVAFLHCYHEVSCTKAEIFYRRVSTCSFDAYTTFSG